MAGNLLNVQNHELGRLQRGKAYDDVDDADLEAGVIAKYPGIYDDIPRTPLPPVGADVTRCLLARAKATMWHLMQQP